MFKFSNTKSKLKTKMENLSERRKHENNNKSSFQSPPPAPVENFIPDELSAIDEKTDDGENSVFIHIPEIKPSQPILEVTQEKDKTIRFEEASFIPQTSELPQKQTHPQTEEETLWKNGLYTTQMLGSMAKRLLEGMIKYHKVYNPPKTCSSSPKKHNIYPINLQQNILGQKVKVEQIRKKQKKGSLSYRIIEIWVQNPQNKMIIEEEQIEIDSNDALSNRWVWEVIKWHYHLDQIEDVRVERCEFWDEVQVEVRVLIKKISLPPNYSYFCQLEGSHAHKLRIRNQNTELAWSYPIDIRSIDFTTAVQIKGFSIKLNHPFLQTSSTATFSNLPINHPHQLLTQLEHNNPSLQLSILYFDPLESSIRLAYKQKQER